MTTTASDLPRRLPLAATIALLLGLAAGSAQAARPTLMSLDAELDAAQTDIGNLQDGQSALQDSQTALQTDVDALLTADDPTNTGQLRIGGASIDFGPPVVIDIELDNFDGATLPTVLLSGTELTVTDYGAGYVTAATAGPLADGDYRLLVEAGADFPSRAGFDLTVADLEEQDPTIGTLQAGKWCDSDGTEINCTSDAPAGGITAVTAGDGLSGGGSSGEVTLAVEAGIQRRVSGTCASGSSISAIASNGTVTCQNAGIQSEVDGSTTNELNTGFSLSGTTLSITDAGGTRSQDIGALQGDFVVKRSDGTEGFRMTTGGNFGIGDYWTDVALNVKSDENIVFQAEDTSGFDLFQIRQSGRVNINDATYWSNIGVNIESDDSLPFYVRNSSNIRLMQLESDGDMVIAGSLSQNSDERLKDAITNLDYGLSEVLAMQPRAYVMKRDPETPEIGLIAQELYPIVPEAVTPGSAAPTPEPTPAQSGEQQESPYWSVAYTKLIPVLIRAIQEQQALIEAQQARLDAAGL
jgi:hypothetical protein